MKKENFFKLLLKMFSGSGYNTTKHETAGPSKNNIWGISGRKGLMDVKTLIHMRPFTSSSKLNK